MRLERRIRLNHADRLRKLEDLVDMLNEDRMVDEQEWAMRDGIIRPYEMVPSGGLEVTQPLPVIDVQAAVLADWASAAREIARWRIEAEDGRLDFLV